MQRSLKRQPNRSQGEREESALLHEVVDRLRGTYEYDRLGNLDDPLDELVYIVLSTRTRGTVFGNMFATLKKRFPSWGQIARARDSTLQRVLEPAGLSHKKARWLKDILKEIGRREGRIRLDHLSEMSNEEAEAYLTSLPGIGLKTARCVLMYSLERQVLPVDANVKRLLERLEVLPSNIHYNYIHDAAQDRVSPNLRADLHVYAVIHGRATCLPRNPRCHDCALSDLCPYPKRATAVSRC